MNRSPDRRFFLVSGTGKTGTTWLGEALNHPDAGIVCFDEGKLEPRSQLRTVLRRFGPLQYVWRRWGRKSQSLKELENRYLGENAWLEACEYELECGVGSRYSSYFENIKSLLQRYQAVGDSHSWEPRLIPQVNDHVPVANIIHLVRNGILNVHSLNALNADLFDTTPLFKEQISFYLDLFGGVCSTPWEYWCFWWSVNSQIPYWLERNLPDTKVDTYRLEDLTSDQSYLNKILEGLSPGITSRIGDLSGILNKNDNRDLTGSRTPLEIWASWSETQKRDFLRICAPTMEQYGYLMP